MHRRVFTALLGFLAFASVAIGCSNGSDPPRVTVSAASSLTSVFQVYSDEIGADARFSFAGSDQLAAQIEQGARPDVFASAEPDLLTKLSRQGLVGRPIVFARNSLVIAVPEGSKIDSVSDLAQPSLDIVIGAPGVPAGDYAREALDRVPRQDAILANLRSEEPDAKGIVAKLISGAADAGFVYATDVRAAAADLDAVAIPASLQPKILYSIAAVKGSDDPDGARQFIAGLSGDGPGVQLLEGAGFARPAR